MYCKNCGNEITHDALFCSSCGIRVNRVEPAAEAEIAVASVSDTAGAATQYDLTPLPKPPKSKRFWILTIAIPLVVVILAAAAWAAYSAGMFLSPKDYYKMAETKNYIQKTGEISSPLTDFIAKYKTAGVGKSSSTSLNMSVSVDKNALPEENAKIIDLLNTLDIRSNTKTNPSDLQVSQEISMSLKDNELLSLNFYLDKTKLYTQAPVLLDKYFLFDLQKVKATLENLGLSSVSLPESITEEEIRSALGADGDKQETKDSSAALLKKYGALYFDSIPEDCIKRQWGSALQVEGRNLKCSKLTITFSEQQFKDFILAFTSAVKDDEELFKLISENAKGSANLAKSYNLGTDATLDKENFKKMIESLEDQVKNDLKMPNGLTMVVWVSKDSVVKRTIDATFDSQQDQVGMQLETSGIKAADGKLVTNFSINLTSKTGTGSGEYIRVAYNGSSWTDKENTSFKNGNIEFKGNLDGTAETGLNMKWDTEIKNSDSGKNISTKYDLNYKDSNSTNNNFRLNGEITDKTADNDKQKTLKDDISLSAYFTAGGDQAKTYGGKLNLAIEKAYDIEFKLPSFDSSKVVDLSTVNQDQLNELQGEAGMSLFSLLSKNPWLGEYFGLDGAFGETEETE